MQLKQLYLEERSGNLCEENPVMNVECDVCADLGLNARDACCSNLLRFADCQNALEPMLREMTSLSDEMTAEEAEPSELSATSEPAAKRYASTFARWGLSRGKTPVQWGRPIRAMKRYGHVLGTKFNFNRFRQGGYHQDPN